MRCPDCGHNNPNNTDHCQVCHSALYVVSCAERTTGAVTGNVWDHTNPVIDPQSADISRTTTTTIVDPPVQYHPVRPRETAHTAPFSHPTRFTSRADVTGRVIVVEPPLPERPDFDVCRALTRMICLLLLVTVGIVFAIIALIGQLLFARLFSIMKLFAFYHIMAGANPLGRRYEREQTPVRYLRIRGEDGESEYVVRMKGTLTNGNLMPDDLVSVWGRWRHGVLHARRAFSHRTETWIELQRSYSWVTLTLTICLILALIFGFSGLVSGLTVQT